MIDLLSVYICPTCGDVLSDQVDEVEIIDTNRDDVWTELMCKKCRSSVTPKMTDGVQHLAEVDHERWLWASGFYDEEWDGDDNYGEVYGE